MKNFMKNRKILNHFFGGSEKNIKPNLRILSLFMILLTSLIVTQSVMAKPQATMIDLGTRWIPQLCAWD